MNKYIPIGASFLGGTTLGSGLTYVIVKKRIQGKAEARANEEIESVKQHYKLLRKEPPYDDPSSILQNADPEPDEEEGESYGDTLQRLGYSVEEIAEIEQIDDTEGLGLDEALVEIRNSGTGDRVELRNIFDEARVKYNGRVIDPALHEDESHDPDEFDLLKARDPEKPFIINTDEFMNDENEFAKITITYYDGDDTLTDDREQIIPNADEVVGAHNLTKFGNFSDDVNTVYIRNERMQTDFEVVREEGSYSTIVLGLREMEEVRHMRRKPDDEE